MRDSIAIAGLAVGQAMWLGAPPTAALAAALALVATWWFSPTRHAAASIALGGVGMLAGAALDRRLGLAASCHEGTWFGFSTLGMAAACTVACWWTCDSVGRRRMRWPQHAIMLATMFSGEEAALALAAVWQWPPNHMLMVIGMGAGTAIGTWTVGVLYAQPPLTSATRPPPQAAS